MIRTTRALVTVALLVPAAGALAQDATPSGITTEDHVQTLEHAQRAFYNGKYETAAKATLEPCSAGGEGLAACEVRTAALHFRIKRAIGTSTDRKKAWKQCAECPDLMVEFQAALARGVAIARARLQTDPEDHSTLFLLGKLNLNYVWLQLGTLGRRTGWDEYWEARRALDRVLEARPDHVRARVARGWIDYIVDTKMPFGTAWLLGGGNKKRGLRAVREAAGAEADFFTRAEARFALWDMQVRERDLEEAVVTARELARDFPDNTELTEFIEAHEDPLPR